AHLSGGGLCRWSGSCYLVRSPERVGNPSKNTEQKGVDPAVSYADKPDGQLALPGLEDLETPPAPPKKQRPVKPVSELIAISYLHLDISPGQVNLLGEHYWELRSPYREDGTILNTGPAPREPIRTSLSDVLELDAKP